MAVDATEGASGEGGVGGMSMPNPEAVETTEDASPSQVRAVDGRRPALHHHAFS